MKKNSYKNRTELSIAVCKNSMKETPEKTEELCKNKNTIDALLGGVNECIYPRFQNVWN